MWAKCVSIIAALVSIAGCEHKPSVPLTAATAPVPVVTLSPRDGAVLEAVLRDRLKDAQNDRTIFLSVGSIGTKWKDPPPDFLKRFADLPYTFKPVSEARLPMAGEMESVNRLRGVEDPATGKRSWIYWAEIKQWVSDTKVRVDVGVWSGPLGGGGGIDVFEFRRGKWVYVDSESSWAS